MNKPIIKNKSPIQRFTVRTLAISASTLTVFDFPKEPYQAGGLLSLG